MSHSRILMFLSAMSASGQKSPLFKHYKHYKPLYGIFSVVCAFILLKFFVYYWNYHFILS